MLLLRHHMLVRLVAVEMMWLVFFIATPSAQPATSTVGAGRPLRVATRVIAPFVLPKTDPPAGFSVDLWNEVARRMRVEFTWKMVTTLPEP